MSMNLLAAISFDPTIRGVLVVLVGVVVLVGSIYLLLATNTGARGGFLIALAGLAGWCFSLGLIWWIYGIGLIGESPTWVEREVNFDRDAQATVEPVNDLPDGDSLPNPADLLEEYEAENPEIRDQIESTEGEGYVPETLTDVVTLVPEIKAQLDEEVLNGWRILPESDARRGEAVAAADAALAAEQVFGQETSPSSYTVKNVYLFGGKEGAEPETIPGERGLLEQAWNRIRTVFQVKNPPQYAAITVQRNIDQVVLPGEAPPPAQIDESAETVTVVFERNLGNRRLIPFLFTLFTGIVFFVAIWMLHTRDRRVAEMRESWDPAAAAG